MDKIKEQLLEFTINATESFLNEHPDLTFYAFAYDCNAEYAEVNLCLNTPAEFEKTLKKYQTGPYAEDYRSEEGINELKFSTGDWEYQCFDTIYVLTEAELTRIFNDLPEDGYKSWNEFIENLTVLFCEVLLDFQKTKTFEKIPKTADFIAFCIDHDEDFEGGMERLEKVKAKEN